MDFSRFDDFYFTIVKETGGIEGLLHSMFNFLIRRTDFYYEADPGDKMGFPPGFSQQMLLNIYKQYQSEHYKKFPKKNVEDYQKKAEIYKKQMEAEKLKKQQQEIEEKRKQFKSQQKEKENINQSQQIQTENQQQNKQELTEQNQSQKNQEQLLMKEQIQSQETKLDEESKTSNQQQEQQQQQQQQQIIPVQVQNQQKDLQQQQQQQQQDKQNFKIVDEKFANISTYNGGVTDRYSWSQNVQEITVQVNVPQGVYKKNVIVDLKTNHMRIQLKSEQQPLIDGELYDKIRVDESLWSIEDNNKIILTLEKANENIWKTVIKGDQEIDATKVDNSKKLEEFDSETQGALRKIMYEQQRKQMGLPTTEEEKQQELLKKAWNAEGSPFKGQPFDPSVINFAQNQNQFNM